MTCPAVMTDDRFFGFCNNILSVVVPFTYLFVLMTDGIILHVFCDEIYLLTLNN